MHSDPESSRFDQNFIMIEGSRPQLPRRQQVGGSKPERRLQNPVVVALVMRRMPGKVRVTAEDEQRPAVPTKGGVHEVPYVSLLACWSLTIWSINGAPSVS